MENSELSDTVCLTAERTLCENRTLNINMASTPIFTNIKKVVPMQNVPNIGVSKPLVSVIRIILMDIFYFACIFVFAGGRQRKLKWPNNFSVNIKRSPH